jgi:hypothetical protein
VVIRTHRKTVVFGRPFRLKGVGRALPPGNYQVVTDEELIEGLSFPVWHRVSTAIIVPAEQASSVEMVAIDPADLQAAQDSDKAANLPAEQFHPNRGDLGAR